MSGTLSYSLAVVVSLTGGTLLLLKSRNGDVPRRAALAAFITALWAAVLAGQSYVGSECPDFPVLAAGRYRSVFLLGGGGAAREVSVEILVR